MINNTLMMIALMFALYLFSAPAPAEDIPQNAQCYTAQEVVALKTAAAQQGYRIAVSDFFTQVSKICASGQSIYLKGVGTVSCRGAKK